MADYGGTSTWILGDQLLWRHPALINSAGSKTHVVMIESKAAISRRPYHKRKLVLLLSAMRHYAQHLRDEGHKVDYIHAEDYLSGLRQHFETTKNSKLITMASADFYARGLQNRLADALNVEVELLDNQQFLVERFNPIPKPEPGKRYVMEYFYRDMRSHFDILLEPDGEPVGGKWNFDKQNRERLPADIDPPKIESYQPDAITQQVIAEINEADYGVGSLAGFNLAVTHAQAQQALDDFIAHRLEGFGPFEDAMAQRDATLFHSVLSPYVNIGLLEPLQLVHAAVQAYQAGRAPINSVEGFVRQVIGWREFMYWQYWRQMPDLVQKNEWQAHSPMPRMFWDGNTDMNCIQHVHRNAFDIGYTHHIERLMLVTNFCTLAGIDPQAVVDWFKAFYIDAYDWVMQPNVVGMGLNADGGVVATKPYISSANYINKMSDYCGDCPLNRKARTGTEACPFNFLYWNFLIQHEETLRANPRLGRNVLGLRHLDQEERQQMVEQATNYLAQLAYYEGQVPA